MFPPPYKVTVLHGLMACLAALQNNINQCQDHGGGGHLNTACQPHLPTVSCAPRGKVSLAGLGNWVRRLR